MGFMLKFCESEYKDYWEGKYLRFIDFGKQPGHKTNLYQIRNVKNNSILGAVKWAGQWRKYAFCTMNDAIFDENCLAEVIEFITNRTKEYRATLPKREMSREARMELYRRKRLTKEQNNGKVINNEVEVVQPNNGLVEGLAPLEVELGVIQV